MGLNYAGNDQKAYKYKGAAIPKGYYVDTNSNVETGLVITDAVDAEGYSLGNEWVWVPVNPIVGNDDYYLEDTGNMAGATSVSYTKYSKLWKFTTNSSTKVNVRTDLASPQVQPSATSGYREPAILTDPSRGEGANYSQVNNRETGNAFDNVKDVATQYVTDFNNMVESVDTYQGFYIGRYEITTNGEKPGTPLNTTWYNFYNQSLAYGTNYTESGMIYGCLWDATMQWLAQSNYWVGNSGQTYSGYGNYKSEAVTVSNDDTTITVKAQGIGQKLLTGQTGYTKSNNIFDISGNCVDLTQEAISTNGRASRGGYYSSANNNYTFATNRDSYGSTSTYDFISSRPYLCIN